MKGLRFYPICKLSFMGAAKKLETPESEREDFISLAAWSSHLHQCSSPHPHIPQGGIVTRVCARLTWCASQWGPLSFRKPRASVMGSRQTCPAAAPEGRRLQRTVRRWGCPPLWRKTGSALCLLRLLAVPTPLKRCFRTAGCQCLCLQGMRNIRDPCRVDCKQCPCFSVNSASGEFSRGYTAPGLRAFTSSHTGLNEGNCQQNCGWQGVATLGLTLHPFPQSLDSASRASPWKARWLAPGVSGLSFQLSPMH